MMLDLMRRKGSPLEYWAFISVSLDTTYPPRENLRTWKEVESINYSSIEDQQTTESLNQSALTLQAVSFQNSKRTASPRLPIPQTEFEHHHLSVRLHPSRQQPFITLPNPAVQVLIGINTSHTPSPTPPSQPPKCPTKSPRKTLAKAP